MWCGDAVKVYLLKLQKEKFIVIYFFINFIDFLQLQKGRMVAGGGVNYLIFDFFSETASWI